MKNTLNVPVSKLLI